MFAGIAVLLIPAAFGLRLLFCFRGKRNAIRCIPTGIILIGELICALSFGIFAWMEKTGMDIHGTAFSVYIYGIILLAAFMGAAFAWGIWGIVRFVQNRRK